MLNALKFIIAHIAKNKILNRFIIINVYSKIFLFYLYDIHIVFYPYPENDFFKKYLKSFIIRFAFSLNLVRQLYFSSLLYPDVAPVNFLSVSDCLIAIGLSSKERPNDVRMKSLYTK